MRRVSREHAQFRAMLILLGVLFILGHAIAGEPALTLP